MKDIFILLYYYWEGDGYLVNEFVGVFDSLESVPDLYKNYIPMKKDYITKTSCKVDYKGLYTDEDIQNAPNSDGYYLNPGYYYITKMTINSIFNKT